MSGQKIFPYFDPCRIHAFISNTFVRNIRLKLAKNQANAKQHPEAELLTGRKTFVDHIRKT